MLAITPLIISRSRKLKNNWTTIFFGSLILSKNQCWATASNFQHWAIAQWYPAGYATKPP